MNTYILISSISKQAELMIIFRYLFVLQKTYESQINSQVIQGFGAALAKFKNLQALTLELNNNILNYQIKYAQYKRENDFHYDEELTGLDFPQENFCKLKKLFLCIYNSKLSSKFASDLGYALSKFSSLSVLDLNLLQNCISDVGAKVLGSQITNCSNVIDLEFDLCDYNIGDQGRALPQTSLTNILELTLSLGNNQIKSIGAYCLSTSLVKIKNLQILSLSLKSNQICYEGLQSLCIGLKNCSKILCLSLDLYYNDIQQAEEVTSRNLICKIKKLVETIINI
ncbi:hypothetical protein ABPG72_005470 [Tetrahymena utriculariae]